MGYWAKDGSYVYDETDLNLREATIREKYGPKGPNYTEAELIEKRKKEERESEMQTRARQQRINENIPYQEEARNWVHNGLNNEKLDEVLDRGTRNYEILNAYFNEFNNSLNQDFFKLLNNDIPTAEVKIMYDNIKRKFNEYVVVLSKLKAKNFDLNPTTLSLSGIHIWNDELLEKQLREVEHKYGKLTMGIPADLSSLYEGAKYQQREGNVMAVLPAFFDELNGKEINWEGYLNLRPGEKTPYQLFKERMAAREAARKTFEETRKAQLAMDAQGRNPNALNTSLEENLSEEQGKKL